MQGVNAIPNMWYRDVKMGQILLSRLLLLFSMFLHLNQFINVVLWQYSRILVPPACVRGSNRQQTDQSLALLFWSTPPLQIPLHPFYLRWSAPLKRTILSCLKSLHTSFLKNHTAHLIKMSKTWNTVSPAHTPEQWELCDNGQMRSSFIRQTLKSAWCFSV